MNAEDFRRLLDALPHGIEQCAVDGTITYSNAAHNRMHGYAPGELTGRSVAELQLSEEKGQELLRFLAQTARERPHPEPFLNRNRTRDGGVVDVEVAWNYLRDDSGRVTGFASVITDITDD